MGAAVENDAMSGAGSARIQFPPEMTVEPFQSYPIHAAGRLLRSFFPNAVLNERRDNNCEDCRAGSARFHFPSEMTVELLP